MKDPLQLPQFAREILNQNPNGHLLLFAHPGFEPTCQLLETIHQQYPNLNIVLLTHVALARQQLHSLPVKDVITFDKRALRRPTELLRMGGRVLQQVTRQKFNLFLVWYRHFEYSPDLLILESFASVVRARRRLFWDDQSGRVRTHQPWRLLYRYPWTLSKWIVVALMATLLMLVLEVVVFIQCRSPRPARRLTVGAPARIAFLRTDIELVLQPMDAGGSVSHVKGIIAGFLAHGAKVCAIAAAPLAGVNPSQIPTRVVRPWLTCDLPREIMEALGSFSYIRQGLPVMRRDGVSLLYQRYSMNNFAGVVLARLLSVPLILEANNSEVEMRRQFSRLTFRRLAVALERWILLSADHIVTVSRRNQETFVQMGIPAEKVHILPNAVDPDVFSPAIGDSGLRRTLGLTGRTVVGFVGLFYPWHGVSHLARGFIHLAAFDPTAHLLLLGDGEERERVRSILEEAGLADRVTLAGMVPHNRVPYYLQAMDILVSPHAPWPGFFGSPIKLFEYLSSGRPVVASAVGQIADIIQDGVNGLLVPPGDEQALADALKRLCRDPALRGRLGAAGRDSVLQAHTWTHTVGRILALARGEA